MPRMDEIVRVCEKHNLILVEDAAPAHMFGDHGRDKVSSEWIRELFLRM